MCIKPSQLVPHPPPYSLEWLLAWPRVHRVLCEVVEQDAVDDDERDDAPGDDLDAIVPLRAHGLVLDAPLELALEAELLALCELGEVGRPLLAHGKAVAREVEGRECVCRPVEETRPEASHGVERSRGVGLWMWMWMRGFVVFWCCCNCKFSTDVPSRSRARAISKSWRRTAPRYDSRGRFWHQTRTPRQTTNHFSSVHALFPAHYYIGIMAAASVPKDAPKDAVTATIDLLKPQEAE